jgi:hypothetical protein
MCLIALFKPLHKKAHVLDVRYERLFASGVVERAKNALLDAQVLNERIIFGVFTVNVQNEMGK